MAWEAKFISAKETDFETGNTEDIKKEKEIVTDFTYSGNGCMNGAVSYSLGLNRNKMHTTWGGDVTLKEATEVGTKDNPHDLSMDNGQMTTANCYVVNAPGVYKLPLVYGMP